MNYLRIFLFVFLQALVVSRIQLFDGLVLPFIYILIKDGLGNGQSYGKRALNIMVINVNSNKPCSKSNSAGRNIMFSIICSVPYIGYLLEIIMVFANPKGRKLSDLVAGTQVIDIKEFESN